MHSIRLQNRADVGATLLPNRFIDQSMLRANGEFVKLYIYLLRCVGKGMNEIPVGFLADSLLCTEGDILRALRYWETQGLLSLQLLPDGAISSVSFTPLFASVTGDPAQSTEPLPEMKSAAGYAADSPDSFAEPEPLPEARSADIDFLRQPPDESINSYEASEEKRAERLASLMQNEDVQQILFIAEQYMGKTLTPTETDKLIYFYDELKMSVDLIDYLIEYCVGKGHHSIRYIETVALAWKDDGVDTVEKAKKSSFTGRKEYFSILRALGIQGRSPVETEMRFMDKWIDEYQLPLPVIYEACNRTILNIGQPSFPYTDRILSDWHTSGVSSLNDINLLDETHQQSRTKKPPKGEPKSSSQAKGGGKFNNFSQRDYDYSDVEKQLLSLNQSD